MADTCHRHLPGLPRAGRGGGAIPYMHRPPRAVHRPQRSELVYTAPMPVAAATRGRGASTADQSTVPPAHGGGIGRVTRQCFPAPASPSFGGPLLALFAASLLVRGLEQAAEEIGGWRKFLPGRLRTWGRTPARPAAGGRSRGVIRPAYPGQKPAGALSIEPGISPRLAGGNDWAPAEALRRPSREWRSFPWRPRAPGSRPRRAAARPVRPVFFRG